MNILKEAIELLSTDQTQLADELGIHKGHMSRLISGNRRVTDDMREDVERLLDGVPEIDRVMYRWRCARDHEGRYTGNCTHCNQRKKIVKGFIGCDPCLTTAFAEMKRLCAGFGE